MITFTANRRRAVCASNDKLTTGSVGIPVEFSFDGWDGISARVAVFRAGDVSIDVALQEDRCTVPPEVLVTPGETLTIGAYGTDAEGTVVIPTVYADAGQIRRGAEPSGIEPTPQTQPLIDQLLAAAQAARDAADEAERLAKAVKDAADKGDFDGEDGASVWTVDAAYTRTVAGSVQAQRQYMVGREGADPAADDLCVVSDGRMCSISRVAATVVTMSLIGDLHGADGASAYQIAVAHGYEGTEAEWLESLHGQDADPAAVAAAQHTADYARLYAETLNAGAGIPLDAVWERGDYYAAGGKNDGRPYRVRTVATMTAAVPLTLQVAAGYQFYVQRYNPDGTVISSSNWVTSISLSAGEIIKIVVRAYPEDATIEADPAAFGAAVTIVNNIGQGGGSGGAVQSVNGKTGAVVLSASDVHALPDTTEIPSRTSQLQNDSGYLTQHQSLAAYRTAAAQDVIDQQQTSAIAAKYTKPGSGIPKTDLASAVQTSLGKADTALQSFTETDPTVPSWAKASSKPSYTASEVGAVAVAQGVAHAGEFVVVGSDGNITTVSVPSAQGVSF